MVIEVFRERGIIKQNGILSSDNIMFQIGKNRDF